MTHEAARAPILAAPALADDCFSSVRRELVASRTHSILSTGEAVLDTIARLFDAPFSRDLLGRCSCGALLAALIVIPLMTYATLLPENARHALVAEWGPVENLTVVLYGSVILGLFAVSRGDTKFFVASAAVVALMAARELDMHKAFTTGSVTALRFYTGDTPLSEKLVASGIVVALGLFLIWYVVKYVGRFWRRLRHGHGETCSLLTVVALLAVAQVMDSFKRLVPGVAIERGTPLHFGLQLVEEVFELAAPLILLLAIGQYVSSLSPRSDVDGRESAIRTEPARLQVANSSEGRS